MTWSIIRSERMAYLCAVLFLVFCFPGGAAAAPAQAVKAVSGCDLISHPARYNGRMVVVKGWYTMGMETSDISFDCRGSIELQVSTSPPDFRRFGFLTEKSTMDAMSKLPPGVHPGDIIQGNVRLYALVRVVGLFECNYGLPNCRSNSQRDAVLVVKSMQYLIPLSKTAPSVRR